MRVVRWALLLLLCACPALAATTFVGANSLSTPAQQVKGVWYVSTSASLIDHGAAGTSGTAAWCAAQTGTVIEFPPDTTYSFGTNWTCSGKTLRVNRGVTLSVSAGKTVDLSSCTLLGETPAAAGAGTLTLGNAGGWLADDLASNAAGKGAPMIGVEGAAAGYTMASAESRVADVRKYGAKGDGTTDDAAAIQAAIDAAEAAGGGVVFFPEGSFAFSVAIILKDKVSLIGTGPLSTILKYTGTGTYGLSGSGALYGITLQGFQLLGTNITNASEDGIHIVGHATTGAPKLVLRDLLVKEWGNDGIYLENAFSVSLANVNASSNKRDGFSLTSCLGAFGANLVGYQNARNGFRVITMTGARLHVTAQENKQTGFYAEGFRGNDLAGYFEQNGFDTGEATTAITRAQLGFTATGAHQYCRGNRVTAYFLGGKGSVPATWQGTPGVTMESGTGYYINYGTGNHIDGCEFENHLLSDIYLTSNSSSNTVGTNSFRLDGTNDTPTPVVSTAATNYQLGPVASSYADVSTSGTGEDDLASTTITGASLGNIGALRITAAGTKTGGGGNKTIKLYFGSASYTFHGAANNTNDWRLTAEIVNTSTAVQRISWQGWDGATPLQGYETSTENTAADVTLKLTGECADGGDTITQTMWTVERIR